MVISKKQVMQLLQLATGYTELLALLESKSIIVNEGNAIRSDIANLYRQISNQQSEKLKEIE